MHFGGAMFFTDYSMSAPELARALEERGFESVWAPEHSHIPLSRKTPFPGGGDLPKQYYDAMDPFVVLAAADSARLRWHNGCRDPQRRRINEPRLQPGWPAR
jgi:alkanesulfonate monooxygenase SsuD/methylene tetrahydromethanopterin reductase-like flavin-dependent oxidoreductase (luciferase family)